MKKLILSAFVIAAISLTSCNNDDNIGGGDIDSTKLHLPKKLTSEGFSATFTYDSKGQIIKLVEDLSDAGQTTYTLTYNNDKIAKVEKVTTGEYASTESFVFTYVNATQVKAELTATFGSETYSDTQTLVLDAKGNLITNGETTYTYTNSNVLTEKWDSATIIYTYDNKAGVFSQVKTAPFVLNYVFQDYYTNISNNVITEKYVDNDDNYEESYAYTYKYNDKGFPIELNNTDDSGHFYTATIQY